MTTEQYRVLVARGADSIEPQIRAALNEARAEMSAPARIALAPIWWIVLSIAPYIARAAIRAVLNYLSSMTVAQVAELLTRYRQVDGPIPPR